MKLWFFLSMAFFLLIYFLIFQDNTFAAVSSWQKGITIVSQFSTDFSSQSFQQSLRNGFANGVNYVTLVVPLYQSNIYSTDIQAGTNTPTDASLGSAIDFAHSLGMGVNVKPHLDPYDGQWRAYIDPADRTTWFKNYGTQLNHFGAVAAAHKAEEITVGSELIRMSSQNWNSSNTQNWINLINNLRGVYGGKLTYSAQRNQTNDWMNEMDGIKFWNSLDILGVSAYYELSGSTANDLQNSWNNYYNSLIAPWQQNNAGKPMLFTEIGYRSVSNSYTQPWNYNQSGSFDPNAQAMAYQALFGYWGNIGSMIGVQLWDWSSNPNAGGSGNTDYTPQNKTAQQTMNQYFGGSGTAPTLTPTPTAVLEAAPNFTFTESAAPNPAIINQTGAFTVTIKNNAATNESGYVIDLELYNSSGQRQVQQFFENQNFTTGETKTYSFKWVPNTTGNYYLALGIFTSSWLKNIIWDQSFAFSVNNPAVSPSPILTPTPSVNISPTPTPSLNPTPTPTPGGSSNSSQINVWWPVNGVSIGGVQPFKANVNNLNISDYLMYWQVDGGNLNPMNDSLTDYPHKEASVDVSSWNWSNSGQYKINFAVKDKNGNVTGQQQIAVTVLH